MKNIHCINNNLVDDMKKNKYVKDINFLVHNKEDFLIKGLKIREDNPLFKDYVRLYFVYQNGGLLLDGNFIVTESLSNLFENDMFLSYITENKITTKIIYAKNKRNANIGKLLNVIEEDRFDNINDVVSEAFNINTSKKINTLIKLNTNSFIYSYDYFFPMDYENSGKNFSENTRMIYFSEQPMSKKIKLKFKIYQKIGGPGYVFLTNMLINLKNKLAYKKYILFHKFLKADISYSKQKRSVKNACAILDSYKSRNPEYIVIHNPRWLGVTNATKELFDNLVPLEEISRKSDAKYIAKRIIDLGVKQVIFSAFSDGWSWIAIELKKIKKDIKIKSFWHGSHSQVIEKINWRTNLCIIELHKKGIIDVFGTCKKSMINFYKSQGYVTAFLDNTVNFSDENKKSIIEKIKKSEEFHDKIKIGMYAAGIDWRKNMYTQLAATALMDNAVVDIIPLNFESEVFASHLNINISGTRNNLKREELLSRIASNDINLYVTFSECAPMVPIESLEMGTICLTGNNHHYFDNSDLKKYLVVDREDDMIEITNKIKHALKNRDKILELYEAWKKEHDINSRNSVKSFLEM